MPYQDSDLKTLQRYRRTVRHKDIKAWFTEFYPDQRPAFLFDEVERNTHAVINKDTFQDLKEEGNKSAPSLSAKNQFQEV